MQPKDMTYKEINLELREIKDMQSTGKVTDNRRKDDLEYELQLRAHFLLEGFYSE